MSLDITDNNGSLHRAIGNLLRLMEVDGYPVDPDSPHMGDEMKMVLNSREYKTLRAIAILRGWEPK